MSADTDHSAVDLKRMDEQTARETLTVAEFERWERINALQSAAEERAAEFDDADATATSVTVDADLSELATEVDVYGNTLRVYLDADDDRLTDAVEQLDAEFGDVEREDLNALGDEDRGTIAMCLEDILLSAIVAWNGTEFEDLPEDEPLAIVSTAREKWGLTPTFEAVMKIIGACNAAQEERFEAIDSFRGAERRGRDRNPRQDRV